VDENKQKPKKVCFGKQKFDFQPNTHVGHQSRPTLQIQNIVKLHKAERWKVRLSATRLSGEK